MDAIIIAALEGCSGIVAPLIQRGADPSAAGTDGRTPLFIAISEERTAITVELAKVLIKCGADVSAANCSGQTPLLQALYLGHTEIAKLLIEGGADVSAANRRGQTPLAIASTLTHREGFTELVEMLLNRGARD